MKGKFPDDLIHLDTERFRQYLLTSYKHDELSSQQIELILVDAEKLKDRIAAVILTGLSIGVSQEKIMEFYNPEFVKLFVRIYRKFIIEEGD